jgi:hypothetical protein
MTTRNERVVAKYLQTYAEPESSSLPDMPRFNHCLVIPVFDETFDDLQQVWQGPTDRCLVILVVNAPCEHHHTTLALMRNMISRAGHVTSSGRCTYLGGTALNGTPDILMVDRCSQGNSIAPGEGVGLARKIGADIALRLISEGVVGSSRISVTDADSILPPDYFKFQLADNDAAIVFPFSHRHETGLKIPTLLYEISMLYYACGLDWAGSSYGYTSLGSTMAFSATHYAKVRGFPRRNAAEDFYLLNKLAKTGVIHRISSRPIVLAGRLSTRVPVGTGPGIGKIAGLQSPLDSYHFYHPGIFTLLKEFLLALSNAWDEPGVLNNTDPAIQHYCREIQLYERLEERLAHHKKKIVFNKFLVDWFDGFRTLKLVHFLRDHYLPSVPLSQLGSARYVDTDLLEDLPALKLQLSARLFGKYPVPGSR